MGYSHVTSVGTFSFQERKKILVCTNMHAPRFLIVLTLVSSSSSAIHRISPLWLKSGLVIPDKAEKPKPIYLNQTPSGICRQSSPGFSSTQRGCQALPHSWSGQESSDEHSCCRVSRGAPRSSVGFECSLNADVGFLLAPLSSH